MASWDLNAARRDALFASTLQCGDDVNAAAVHDAIRQAVRRFGVRGCAGRVAQEFGDHPDLAVARMGWVRSVLAGIYLPHVQTRTAGPTTSALGADQAA